MKIPAFSRANVKAAVKEIDRNGVQKRRRSIRFCLQVGARHYPPKYVLELAVRDATGKALLPAEHSGGTETNTRFEALDYTIVECSCGGIDN
jgi:hypothetical protein